MNKLAEKLTLEMIPDGIWHTVAEEIGVSNLIKLAELVGGANIYIPKAESFVRPVLYEKIKEEYNGYNTAQLARKYGITERWVREICGDDIPGQMELIEYLEGLGSNS
ncbi:Mor transcription activator family protein [Hungatella hathewayi]